MYSREERMKALELYIKHIKNAATVMMELGYPGRKSLARWYKIYIKEHICLLTTYVSPLLIK